MTLLASRSQVISGPALFTAATFDPWYNLIAVAVALADIQRLEVSGGQRRHLSAQPPGHGHDALRIVVHRERHDVTLSRQTLGGWVEAAAD